MILLGTHDAGPANVLVTIIQNWNNDFVCVSSDISRKVFETNNIQSTGNLYRINTGKIDLIITGTCWGWGLDKELILLGKEHKIPTVSIVEHWAWYKQRFLINNSELILPDYIIVNDTGAYKKAIQDGLPEKSIKILGNPYLESLIDRKLSPKNKLSWLKDIGLDEHDRTITFISESYRSDFPKGTELYQGFDEYDVVGDLQNLAKSKGFILLIKLHPTEKPEKYNEFVDAMVLHNPIDEDSLLLNSDYIIGMGSMYLIENSAFRNDIISYRPNEKEHYIGNKLKYTYGITNYHGLLSFFNHHDKVNNHSITDSFKGSMKKYIDFFDNNILLDS